MSRVIIIGGGLAGLSTAVYLLDKGIDVEIFEASPKLGGRAYSFTHEVTGDKIDNGQHLMMGCYKYFLSFLKLIGASENLIHQKKLRINFAGRDGMYILNASKLIYPFNLLLSLLNYKAISFRDRWKIIWMLLKLVFINTSHLKNLTVKEWLEKENQSRSAVKAFWEIINIGAMNSGIDKVSAALFAEVLRQIFFKGNMASTLIIPAKGLSETFCPQAVEFITGRGGKINLSSPVSSVEICEGAVKSFFVKGKKITDFDYLISAVPDFSFRNIFPSETAFGKHPELEYSPIVTVHIWLRLNPFKEKFYGLIDSPVHWIFNHGNFISTVTSNAYDLRDRDKTEIFNIISDAIEEYFPEFVHDTVYHYKVIKEKRATYIPKPGIEGIRPSSETKIRNLFLAGDWTETGLPATMEAAVKSGNIAAKIVESKLREQKF